MLNVCLPVQMADVPASIYTSEKALFYALIDSADVTKSANDDGGMVFYAAIAGRREG